MRFADAVHMWQVTNWHLDPSHGWSPLLRSGQFRPGLSQRRCAVIGCTIVVRQQCLATARIPAELTALCRRCKSIFHHWQLVIFPHVCTALSCAEHRDLQRDYCVVLCCVSLTTHQRYERRRKLCLAPAAGHALHRHCTFMTTKSLSRQSYRSKYNALILAHTMLLSKPTSSCHNAKTGPLFCCTD